MISRRLNPVEESRTGALMLLACAAAAACAACYPLPGQTEIDMNWELNEALNQGLPETVRVYSGSNDSWPLRAWYVWVEEQDPDVITRVLVSDDEDDVRETVASFALDTGACIVVNGGYFRMDLEPTRHVGLLVEDGEILNPATRSVRRNDQSFEIARAAIGFTGADTIAFGWISTLDGVLYSWSEPPLHQPGEPAEPLDYSTAEVWEVRDAIGAGPALVVGGQTRITADEEVFFGTTIPDVHPRTAAARTSDGSLILMVVDGRQPGSRGVNLEELAALLRGVGAVDAVNLDGGGSSTLVVNGSLVNRPVGVALQREVMSAIATFCGDPEEMH
jgi:exopolysaccharide biosynthesis protein